MNDNKVDSGYRPVPSDNPFISLVGPLYSRLEGSKVRFKFQAEQKHTNKNGVIHGGMLATFMDYLLSHTVDSIIGNVNKATVNLACDFCGPAYPQQKIDGWGNVTKVGRNIVFADGKIYADEQIVVIGSANFKLFKID